jgi:hypothetical protein
LAQPLAARRGSGPDDPNGGAPPFLHRLPVTIVEK